ncbi:17594_t:CDS:2 [Entrophospora sp. SA101]|nr:17594_t:CDS:2 [Entrophospora sp. SA101]
MRHVVPNHYPIWKREDEARSAELLSYLDEARSAKSLSIMLS